MASQHNHDNNDDNVSFDLDLENEMTELSDPEDDEHADPLHPVFDDDDDTWEEAPAWGATTHVDVTRRRYFFRTLENTEDYLQNLYVDIMYAERAQMEAFTVGNVYGIAPTALLDFRHLAVSGLNRILENEMCCPLVAIHTSPTFRGLPGESCQDVGPLSPEVSATTSALSLLLRLPYLEELLRRSPIPGDPVTALRTRMAALAYQNDTCADPGGATMHVSRYCVSLPTDLFGDGLYVPGDRPHTLFWEVLYDVVASSEEHTYQDGWACPFQFTFHALGARQQHGARWNVSREPKPSAAGVAGQKDSFELRLTGAYVAAHTIGRRRGLGQAASSTPRATVDFRAPGTLQSFADFQIALLRPPLMLYVHVGEVDADADAQPTNVILPPCLALQTAEAAGGRTVCYTLRGFVFSYDVADGVHPAYAALVRGMAMGSDPEVAPTEYMYTPDNVVHVNNPNDPSHAWAQQPARIQFAIYEWVV